VAAVVTAAAVDAVAVVAAAEELVSVCCSNNPQPVWMAKQTQNIDNNEMIHNY
jgi:hypothetical protein